MKKYTHLKANLREGTLVSRYNTLVAGLLGASSHFLFYFLYTYILDLPYENIWLRLIATLFCISLIFINRLPTSFHPYLSYYWHFTLIFSIPFIFTVSLFMNNFHELWLYSEIAMVFILMMFVPNWLIFTIDLTLGVAFALIFYLLSPHTVQLHQSFDPTVYSIVLAFSILAGYILSLSNWKSLKELERQKAEEKYLALEALAGSIAHEMRNPFSQIRHNLDDILLEIPQLRNKNSVIELPSKNIEKINRRVTQAQMAVNRGLHVITMTLGNFRNTDVSQEDLTYLSAITVTRKAIEEYGYASEHERQMIHFQSDEDFIFRGDETNYTLVLYNLLVNALQVINPRSGGKIDIQIQTGETLNRVSVKDNGSGIPSDILPKIFEPFFTSGKKGGTGLGLAFCKRVMHSFKGDITCNTEKDRYTEFILEFPVLDKSVITQYESDIYSTYTTSISGKKILSAGVPEEYAPLLHRQLSPLNITLDEAETSTEARKMIETKQYDLLLANSDIFQHNQEILTMNSQNNGSKIPVVVFSTSIKPVFSFSGTNDTLIFMPTSLTELLPAMKNTLEAHRNSITDSLSDKTVLVTDDLDFNRKVIKSMLAKLGIRILEATNGFEALEILKTQQCDLLIIDMRMPVLDGFETAKQIRSEKTPYQEIPILGLSGNMDNDTLKIAQECGINDNMIKPLKLKPFQQKVTEMLRIKHPAA